MTELGNNSTERSNDAVACAIKLLHHYGFDLGGHMLSQLLVNWQQHYPMAWIRLATIEALYQGRYKAISVEQILAMWQRRSQPLPHFNHEFERLVCDNLPEHLLDSTPSIQSEPSFSRATPTPPQAPQYRAALQLPSFERAPLPEADVMLALRTLHSKEMAALQAGTLTDATPTEALSATLPQQPTQTYSYSLRSEEASSSTAPDEHDVAAQNEAESSLLAAPHSEAVEQHKVEDEGSGSDVSGHQALDAMSPNANAPLEGEIAPLSEQDGSEPLVHSTAAPLPPSTLPASEAQASILPPIGAIAKILQQLEHQEQNNTELSALGLNASILKPKLQLHLTTHYQPIWLTDPTQKQPIHQFTPDPEPSNFSSKLKAVAEPLEKPQAGESQPNGN